MLTLFIHFLLNMEPLTWPMPLCMCQHSCTRILCAHVCEGKAAQQAVCTHAQENTGYRSLPGEFLEHQTSLRTPSEELSPALDSKILFPTPQAGSAS